MITFRPYRRSDYFSLLNDCYQNKAPKFIIDELDEINAWDSEQKSNGRSLHLVGVQQNLVLASGFLHATPLYIELTDLFVQPQLRNTGIGTKLVYALIDAASTYKVNAQKQLPIELTVRASNSRAKKLYLKLGFVEKRQFEFQNEIISILRLSGSIPK